MACARLFQQACIHAIDLVMFWLEDLKESILSQSVEGGGKHSGESQTNALSPRVKGLLIWDKNGEFCIALVFLFLKSM